MLELSNVEKEQSIEVPNLKLIERFLKQVITYTIRHIFSDAFSDFR